MGEKRGEKMGEKIKEERYEGEKRRPFLEYVARK